MYRTKVWRLNQTKRILKKRSKYYNIGYDSPRNRRTMLKTPKPCSCFDCGNPRKHFNEDHLQEVRQNSKEKYG